MPESADTAGAATVAWDWDALVAEFRALGGTATNITLGHGSRGRGLFAIDPAQPVRLHVPPNLLVPTGDTELRDGQLVVKASATLGERERAFFDRYQREFSWGAGISDELRREQLAWSQLPQPVQAKLRQIGPIDGRRFSGSSDEVCYRRYLDTRQIDYRGKLVLMPLTEMVNHGNKVGAFDCSDGVAIGGTFDGEVLVEYSDNDCWGNALTHGFCEARQYALSLAVNFKFEDRLIRISRELARHERFENIVLPIVNVAQDAINFSFLVLGNSEFPLVPRSIFLHVAKKTPIKRPDEMFDLLEHQNRLQFLEFLRLSEGLATPLAAMLRRAAYQQFETLSAQYGSRPLGQAPAER